jgi:hypothetical protein
MNKTLFIILSALDSEPAPRTSTEITSRLKSQGIELSDRTVRHHLKMLDDAGYTERAKRAARKLTEKGKLELSQGFVSERVGFAINRINNLSFLSDFNIDTLKGKIILNVTFVAEERAGEAVAAISPVLNSPYAMSNRMVIARGGENLGELIVPAGLVGIGTVCSITLNAIFLKAGIPVCSRFGGIVEIVNRIPTRFLNVISYESSSVAPLQMFMKSRMTDVTGAVTNGAGRILGSFREIPGVSLGDAKELNDKMKENGFGGIILFGQPDEPLLGMPVTAGKSGIVVLGGLNPVAVLEEAEIPTDSRAMATLCEYGQLRAVEGFDAHTAKKSLSVASIIDRLYSKKDSRSNYWSIFSEVQQTTL